MDDDSDFSVLTELEDDESDVPLSQNVSPSKKKSKKANNANDGPTLIRDALRMHRSANYSTESLYSQMISDDISLDADYQREVVWPETKMIGVIDSLFRNYYIPPIIFAVNQTEDGSQRRICIDGKQRLTSIQKYKGDKYFFKENSGRRGKGKLLPQKYKNLFKMKTLVCVEYDNLTGDQEREIFQRVQLGMALTPAEKMQAINTKRASFIRDLLSDYVTDTDSLESHLDWDTSRAADFRGIASAVYALENWSSTVAPAIASLTKWLQQPSDFPEPLRRNARHAFAIFLELAKHRDWSSVFKMAGVKRVAPLEFVYIPVLISLYKNQFTMAQLSDAIGKMRVHIRSREQDIRLNTRCVKIMVSFIKSLKTATLVEDNKSPVASQAVRLSSLKRKRGDAEEGETSEESDDEKDELEESDEERPPRKTTKRTAPKKNTAPTPPQPAVKAEPPPQTPSIPSAPATTSTQPNHPPPSSLPPKPPVQPPPRPSSARGHGRADSPVGRMSTAVPGPSTTRDHEPPPPQNSQFRHHVYAEEYPPRSPAPYDPSDPRFHPTMSQPPPVASSTDRLAAIRAAKERPPAMYTYSSSAPPPGTAMSYPPSSSQPVYSASSYRHAHPNYNIRSTDPRTQPPSGGGEPSSYPTSANPYPTQQQQYHYNPAQGFPPGYGIPIPQARDLSQYPPQDMGWNERARRDSYPHAGGDPPR
ncbi:hypothetical protein K474DRAFT_1647415 [Panus rudis PR-1116 ss-1]|nr:hypothetical protein K474DRAFT_1647415 [Panus rudis PR-1116 ss-1]